MANPDVRSESDESPVSNEDMAFLGQKVRPQPKDHQKDPKVPIERTLASLPYSEMDVQKGEISKGLLVHPNLEG